MSIKQQSWFDLTYLVSQIDTHLGKDWVTCGGSSSKLTSSVSLWMSARACCRSGPLMSTSSTPVGMPLPLILRRTSMTYFVNLYFLAFEGFFWKYSKRRFCLML